MKITSRHKKTAFPAIAFIASTAAYFLLLGSLSAVLMAPIMGVSAGIFLANNVDPIVAWFNRDGLK